MISKSHAAAKNVLSLILLSVTTLAFADGPFDPTFAGGGLFQYSYFFGDEFAGTSGIARDSAGRIVVATSLAHKADYTFELAATRHEILFPLLYDGQLDGTFGGYGMASGFFGSGRNSYANAIAIDHRDRIIVGGAVGGAVNCPDGTTEWIYENALVRIRDDSGFDGQADLTFGALGVSLFGDCSHYTNGVAAMAVDADDSIVTTGSFKQEGHYKASIVRQASNGQLDSSFGSAGSTSVAFMEEDTIGAAVAIDSKGRILIAGQATNDDAVTGLLMRFTSDGKLDTTFGSGGYALLGTISDASSAYAGSVCCIAVDSADRAIVAGSIFTATLTTFVARFTDQGAPDETFGKHGFVYSSTDQMTEAEALAIDDQGRPVVGGLVRSSYFPTAVTALSHFNLDGSLNKAIGYGGTYTAAFGFSGSYVTSMLIDGLGRPTLTAIGDDSDSRQVPVLIRYDELFGDGFD